MTDTVFLQKDTANNIYRWVSIDSQGNQSACDNGELAQAADTCKQKRVVLILPGIDVLLTQVSVPTRNRQRLLKAIPYAMEEHIIDEVDALHFAVAEQREGENTHVCAISRASLTDLMGELKSAGINPSYVTPDILCIPYTLGAWSMLLEDDVLAIRTGPYAGFSMDAYNMIQALEIALSQNEGAAPEKIQIYDCRSAEINSLDTTTEQIQGIPVEVTPADHGLDVLARNLDYQNTINLLQGEFSPRKQQNLLLKVWVPAIATVCAIVMIQFVSTLLHNYEHRKQAVYLKTEIEKVFRQALPEAKRISHERQRMSQKLQQLKSGSDSGQVGFINILGNTAKVFGKYKNLDLTSMQYRNGELDIEMTVRNLQILDALKKDISETGTQVDIRSASASGNQVVSRLRLKGGG